MKQCENRVKIEGILSEIDLVDGEFTKDGKTMPYIRGNVKIRVNYSYENKDYDIDVPVDVFVTKWTRNGTINPAYKSMEDVKNNFVSIAAAATLGKGEEMADRVRITNGQLTENAFYASTGELVCQTRITASFINKIKKEDCKPEATFINNMVVAGIIDEMDDMGEPTGNLIIRGAVVQYGDKVDIINYKVTKKSAVDYISSNWSQGDTVHINGILNYSAKTVSTTIENDFGDPITDYRTVNVRELLIVGGSAPFSEDMAYTSEDISSALAARKARIEATKEPKPVQKTTTAASGFSGLDF